MGEGRRRKKLTAQVLEAHPLCCYCGGKTAATTADHVPAKIMFWGKRRPNGLEVGACQAGNNGTRSLEQVAAVFARVSVQDEHTAEQRAEFREIVGSVSRAFPGWQQELFPGQQATEKVAAIIGLTGNDYKVVAVGPLLQDAFFTVGAKLAFALHREYTGKILPPEGVVEVAFETNVPRSKTLPADWFAGFGPTQTLKQGDWTSDGHFAYRAEWNPDGSVSRFVCHIGKALAFFLFVAAHGDEMPETTKQMRRFRPGDLQRADGSARGRYITPLPVTRTGGAASGTLG